MRNFDLRAFGCYFLVGVCSPLILNSLLNYLYVLLVILLFISSIYLFCYFVPISQLKQLKFSLRSWCLNLNFFGLFLGFFWIWGNIYYYKKNSNLSYISENKDIVIIAKILEANNLEARTNILDPHVKKADNITRLDLEVNEVFCGSTKLEQLQISKFLNRSKIRVNWLNPSSEVIPGDFWRLHVRLKKPHNFATIGSFDLEKQLFSKRIKMLGVVIKNRDNKLISRTAYGSLINKIRWLLIDQFKLLIKDWNLKKKGSYLPYY